MSGFFLVWEYWGREREGKRCVCVCVCVCVIRYIFDTDFTSIYNKYIQKFHSVHRWGRPQLVVSMSIVKELRVGGSPGGSHDDGPVGNLRYHFNDSQEQALEIHNLACHHQRHHLNGSREFGRTREVYATTPMISRLQLRFIGGFSKS
jgi:hypothetical protein